MPRFSTPSLLLSALTLIPFASCGNDDPEADGFGQPVLNDTADAVDLASNEEALNSSIYDRARGYASAHPRRDGASWNQWCGSLVWRFGQCPASSARPSAIDAYRHSNIVSTDASKALTGAIHYWDIGQYGHVGVDLNGGGQQVFMATYKLQQSWGDAIGINSVSGYKAASGARYLGWSMDYSGCRIAGGGQQPLNTGVTPASTGLARTSTESDGVPGPIYWKRIQTVGRRDFGYSGPIDGVPGPATHEARVKITARELNRRGTPVTAAVADGVPGPIYWQRVQTVGRQSFDYAGPIDSVPGSATHVTEHKIAAYAVNRAF